MGALWPLLVPPGATLGRVLAALGPPLRGPGPAFERSWPLLGDSCECAGLPQITLGWLRGARETPKSLPRPFLERFWEPLGTIWGRFGNDLGTMLGSIWAPGRVIPFLQKVAPRHSESTDGRVSGFGGPRGRLQRGVLRLSSSDFRTPVSGDLVD